MALAEYGKLPEIQDGALSPDGSKIAVLTKVKGEPTVVVLDSAMQPLNALKVGDGKFRGLSWADNGHILLMTSATQYMYGFTATKGEFGGITVIPIDPSEPVNVIFSNRRNLADAVMGRYGVRNVDGHTYGYYGAWVLKFNGRDYVIDHARPFLYRVDLVTNKAEQIDGPADEGDYRDWLIGRDGEIGARLDVDRRTGEWTIRRRNAIIARGTDPGGNIGFVAFGKNEDTLIYRTRDASDDTVWFEVPLAGGEPQEFYPEADIERIYIDPNGGNILGFLRGGEQAAPEMFDPGRQQAAEKIRQAFGKFDMTMVDFTSDLGSAIVRTSGNGDSGTWYLVDTANLRAKAFGYEHQAIDPAHVGPISVVDFKAEDGMDLDGILTLPPGREAKDLPVVLLPHGGPGAYDSPGFDWWAQAFASRGYAVFQPNFRGSTNRDDAFRRAGFGEWGRKMQTDVSDGLQALADKGIVDPERACIVGASYGGYAALAGVTLQHDIYRCAVSVAGVSDIEDLYEQDYWQSGESRTSKTSLLEQLGPRSEWDARSPLSHAAAADAPILLIHGKDDTVVPYSHTSKMADALKDAGKPYDVVTLDGEDHWLSKAETRQTMLEAAVNFVMKNNPAD